MKPREPLSDLAAIVSAINAAAHERARLGALLDVLSSCGIFDSVVALGNKGPAKPFIAFDVRGDRESLTSATGWPFRRLFDTMYVRRIRHPRRAATALAIPLDYGDERCVLLADLNSWAHDESLAPFFETLENLCVPRRAPAAAPPEGIPVSPVEPRVAAFGLCPVLYEVLNSMLARRGWPLRVPRNLYDLRSMVENGHADVLFLDLQELPDPLGTLLRIHRILHADAKLIGFGEASFDNLKREGLLDDLIYHEAREADIFAAVKRFARQVPELRKSRLREMTTGFEMAVRDSRTPSELSAAGARHAANVMSGWASMHLVSESGTTYASEHPRQRELVLAAIPKTFLSDTPFFQLRADERFYQEISDDRRVVGALERLHPVSAASIPLRHGDRRIGTLVSVSRDVAVDSSTFEALDGFAKVVSRRFEDLAQAAMLGPAMERNGAWECVRHGALEFAAYRSRISSVAWDYRAIRSDFGLLVAGDDIDFPSLQCLAPSARFLEEELAHVVAERARNGRVFLAACDPVASTVTYAASGFPVPLLFDATGPAGSLSARGSVVRGVVTIVPPAGLLVWDVPLRRWLVRESVEMQSVTETLEDLRPPGLAIVVTSLAGA